MLHGASTRASSRSAARPTGRPGARSLGAPDARRQDAPRLGAPVSAKGSSVPGCSWPSGIEPLCLPRQIKSHYDVVAVLTDQPSALPLPPPRPRIREALL